MSTKIYTSIFFLFLLGGLSPAFAQQNPANNMKRPERRTNEIVKLSYEEQIRRLSRKDPRMPDLSYGTVNSVLEMIKQTFVKFDPPETLKELSAKFDAKNLRLKAFSNILIAYMKNPELEEATGYRLSWYRKVTMAMAALEPSLKMMDQALMTKNESALSQIRNMYKIKAEELEKIINKPEKLSAQELAKIKTRNYQQRKNTIQRKIQELNRKRRTQG